MTTKSITFGQAGKIAELAAQAVKKFLQRDPKIDRDTAQRILADGGSFQDMLEPHVAEVLRRFSVGASSDSKLPENHSRIRVNRGPLPPMSALEEMYSKNGVSALFNGQYEWKKHSSRQGANDVTAEEVVIVAKQFTEEEIRQIGGLESENIIACGIRNGLVAADEKETHAFGINPETRELQRKNWYVGLGSSAVLGGHRCVAVLGSDSDGRVLVSDWFGSGWYSDRRFLFVRK